MNGYAGRRAECPEALLTCPNKCGADKIKQKDMESHRSQCPNKTVECPFADAGCKIKVHRHRLKGHMTSSLQQHLMLLMIDRKQLKKELVAVKDNLSETETKLEETNLKVHEAETKIEETKLKLHEAEA